MRMSTLDVSPLRHQRDGLDGLSPQPAHDPLLQVLELSRIVVGDMALDEVLTRVAQVTKDTVPGADEVSVTLVHRDHPSTAAYTGDLALGLDERQYAEGYGPCLQAARSGETQLVSDMSTETRWPKFAAQGVRDGARSSLSVALPMRQETLGASNIETVGALNIYARTRNAFGEGAQQIAPHLAGYAAVAIINASLYVTTTALSEQMSKAMNSRAVIEQAKGILMGERHCSADDAFAILTKISQDANRKLRDVATALVDQTRADPPRRG
jgi:GAF domain-containing protein